MVSNKAIIRAFEVMRNDGAPPKKPVAYKHTTLCKNIKDLVEYVKKTKNVTVKSCKAFCLTVGIEIDASITGDIKDKAATAIAAALYAHPDFVAARAEDVAASKKKIVVQSSSDEEEEAPAPPPKVKKTKKPVVVVQSSSDEDEVEEAPAPAKIKKTKKPVVVVQSSDEEGPARPAPKASKVSKKKVESDSDSEAEPDAELAQIAAHDRKRYAKIMSIKQQLMAAAADSDSD
jgi:ribosome-binding ATPase YchF (GTP1/OBG family)